MPPRIVLLGPPASGKGTQGRQLASSLGLAYLSTGALLREAMECSSPLGIRARPILDQGGYLPDDLMCRVLSAWLESATGGWLLDGFPRSVPQAIFLDGWLKSRALFLDAVIALDVPKEELLRRAADRVECPDCRWSGPASVSGPGCRCPVCGASVLPREDDVPERFLARCKAYETFAMPLLDYYTGRGILHRCAATAPPDQVAAAIIKQIIPVIGHGEA